MEKFSAEAFCKIASRLGGISQSCAEDGDMDAAASLALYEQLQKVSEQCEKIGLAVTAEFISEAIKSLVADRRMARLQVSQMLHDVGAAMVSEMKKHLFLRVFQERIRFFQKEDAFGEEVSANFPRAIRDIRDSGTCYALDQNTACAMHLMRVLELGLATLASDLNVSFERRDWENVINDIEKKIGSIGPSDGANWKAKRDSYAEAAKDFRFLKNGGGIMRCTSMNTTMLLRLG